MTINELLIIFFYEILLNIIDKGFTKAESHIFIILIEISS